MMVQPLKQSESPNLCSKERGCEFSPQESVFISVPVERHGGQGIAKALQGCKPKGQLKTVTMPLSGHTLFRPNMVQRFPWSGISDFNFFLHRYYIIVVFLLHQ